MPKKLEYLQIDEHTDFGEIYGEEYGVKNFKDRIIKQMNKCKGIFCMSCKDSKDSFIINGSKL